MCAVIMSVPAESFHEAMDLILREVETSPLWRVVHENLAGVSIGLGFDDCNETSDVHGAKLDVVVFDDALDRLRDSDIAGAGGPETHYKLEAYRHVKEMAARLVEHGPPDFPMTPPGRCLCNTEIVGPDGDASS
jgi:hypothetical protein